MPMDFPDMNSLIQAAEVHKFRAPQEGETEESFRSALANHVRPIDMIESEEIRNKVGWDKFSDSQNKGMVFRSMMDAFAKPSERVQYIDWEQRTKTP